MGESKAARPAITLADVERAAAGIRGAVVETPCTRSRTLSAILGPEIWLKFENLQFTASYKERGALSRLLALDAGERKRGVIAMSAGNHGQGVAYHAAQGTIALEMLAEVPDLDVLVVPIGGGGLVSGMAIAAKALRPEIQIIGAEAALYPSMYNALKSAHLPVSGDTLAEGIAVKHPGELTEPIAHALLDDIMLVSEAEIERALCLLLNIEKTVVEGAAAAGLAAVIANPNRFMGRKVGIVLTGGNIDARLLASVLTRELAREGRLSRLSIDIPDRPGELARVAAAIGSAGANIVEVYHQRIFTDLPARGTELNLVIETRDRAHLDAVLARLKESGYEVVLKSSSGETA
jgi:threonine dehydratase